MGNEYGCNGCEFINVEPFFAVNGLDDLNPIVFPIMSMLTIRFQYCMTFRNYSYQNQCIQVVMTLLSWSLSGWYAVSLDFFLIFWFVRCPCREVTACLKTLHQSR